MTELSETGLLALKEVFGDSITRPEQVSVEIQRQSATLTITCSDVDDQDLEYLADAIGGTNSLSQED